MGYSPWGCKKSDTTKQLSMSRCLEKVRRGCVDRCCSALLRSISTAPALGHSFPSCSEGFQQSTSFLSPLGIAATQKNGLTQGYSPSPGRGNLYAMTSWYGDQKAFPKVGQL